jgi:hypothetical protein
MRKFVKEEVDLLYNLIKSDEEVLWKSKPNLVPNFTIITTLILFFVASLLFTITVYMNDKSEFWYLFSLIGLDIGIVTYTLFYAYRYYHSINHLFYVITNERLAIIDGHSGRISVYKRYNLIKILRIKKTIFNTASIIFDVDFLGDKMKEIGFINVNNADQVLEIIHQQLKHIRPE